MPITAEIHLNVRLFDLARLSQRHRCRCQEVAAIEAGRWQYLDGGDGYSQCRTHRHGDRSAGRPLLHHEADPAAGHENEPSKVFSPDKLGHCAWNELSTSDPAAARRFDGEQFGWTSDDFMDMGENGEYRFVDHQGLRLGAIAGTMGGQEPHWRFYFRVASVQQAKETAEAKGGKIVMGPMEVPGGDHIIIGIDPQGAEFALVGKA